jgi:hypothetical protein
MLIGRAHWFATIGVSAVVAGGVVAGFAASNTRPFDDNDAMVESHMVGCIPETPFAGPPVAHWFLCSDGRYELAVSPDGSSGDLLARRHPFSSAVSVGQNWAVFNGPALPVLSK